MDPPLINGHYLNGNHDGGVFNSFNLGAYAYCRQNPVVYLDPDGNQYNVIDYIKPQATQLLQSAGNKIKQTISQVTNTINQAKSVVTNTANKVKETVTQTRDYVVNTSAKQKLNDAQKIVKENKSEILSVANSMQKVGENTTTVGLVGAAAGTVTGVGAAAGLTVAGAGAFTEGAGKLLEISTNLISGDILASGEGASSYLISEGAGMLINQAIPGPNPKAAPIIRDAIDTTKQIIKNSAEKTAEKTVE